MGGDLSKVANAKNLQEQNDLFEQYIAPVFETRLFRFIANQPIALYSLGIPLSQFSELKADAKNGIHLLFKERMRHLACDFPIEENCFAQQAFARRYDTSIQSALPMYLQEQYFSTLRKNIDRVHGHHTTLTEFLSKQTKASMDAYVFLDAQDWMDELQITQLWEQVNRTAAPGAKVIFRTGGSISPLEKKLPSSILSSWSTDPNYNRHLYATDRSAIYGGVHLYKKTH